MTGRIRLEDGTETVLVKPSEVRAGQGRWFVDKGTVDCGHWDEIWKPPSRSYLHLHRIEKTDDKHYYCLVEAAGVVCKAHPRYQAKRKPRVPCEACWRRYIQLNPG